VHEKSSSNNHAATTKKKGFKWQFIIFGKYNGKTTGRFLQNGVYLLIGKCKKITTIKPGGVFFVKKKFNLDKI